MLYDFEGRTLRGGITQGWCVDPEHRNSSLKLMGASYRQPVDVWIDGSASEPVSKVLTALKVDRIPAPDYDVPMHWPVRYRAFAAVALRRKGVPASSVMAWPVGATLRMVDWARRWGRTHPSAQVRRIDQIDDRFDDLWQRIRSGPSLLRAFRTGAVLQWRFHQELASRGATVLVYQSGGKLQGYALLLHSFRRYTGLKACDVGDLQAVNDNPDVLRDLLVAALHAAREEGADTLKLMAGAGSKRSTALALGPYTYHAPFWELFYRVNHPGLAKRLASADAWDFSRFDNLSATVAVPSVAR